MQKFSNVSEIVNALKPVDPVYCIRPDFIKKAVSFFNSNLLNYLHKPYSQIKNDWENKSARRKDLIEKYISSKQSKDAGEIAADFLLKNNYFRTVKKCVG